MAGATRPVGGGAYSSPRSEPGGQNTPRAGRVVAPYGTYTTALGLFAQQVDQGSIADDAGNADLVANGSGVESFDVADSGAATVTASGTGTEFYTAPVPYTDAASGKTTVSGPSVESYSAADSATGMVTASGSGSESSLYTDSRTATVIASGIGFQTYTPYDAVLDEDNPISHWKLGGSSLAVDRKGVQNLPALNGP